jgi:hypothetical protein
LCHRPPPAALFDRPLHSQKSKKFQIAEGKLILPEIEECQSPGTIDEFIFGETQHFREPQKKRDTSPLEILSLVVSVTTAKFKILL